MRRASGLERVISRRVEATRAAVDRLLLSPSGDLSKEETMTRMAPPKPARRPNLKKVQSLRKKCAFLLFRLAESLRQTAAEVESVSPPIAKRLRHTRRVASVIATQLEVRQKNASWGG